VQAEYSPPMPSEHWNVEFASVDVKLKVAAVLFVGLAGFAVIVVLGGVISTVHE
jgi:hypothetical protein